MALDPTQIAGTDARTVPSIVIKATNPAGKMVTIGAIKRMSRTITRNMHRRRELDSNPPGVTVEIVPGNVGTFDITIERAMLNKSNMLEAFGISGVEDIISQNIPIDIQEDRNLADGRKQVVTYKGCYFKENPISIDIDGEWVIVQNASLEVATAEVKDPS